MNLPLKLTWDLAQYRWSTLLNKVLGNEITQGTLLTSVSLANGNNVVNHNLGRNLIGWFPTRIRGTGVTLYDTQDSNKTPNLTLNLHASTAVVVDLYVF